MIFEVIERSGRKKLAEYSKGRINYQGRALIPVAISSVMDAGGGNGLGGAVVGGLLLGGAGMIAGSVIGASKGQASFIVKVDTGDELLCTVSKKGLPNLYRLLTENMKVGDQLLPELHRERAQVTRQASALYSAPCLFLGPFYLLKFGFLRFVGAAAVTFLSSGLAWPLLPFWSAAIVRKRAKERVLELTRTIEGLTATSTTAVA